MPLTSFVHDFLDAHGPAQAYDHNRPAAVDCVHPLVTLLEKLDAIVRRYSRDPFDAAAIVRHYEDAARIIQRAEGLPPLPDGQDIRALAASWLRHRLVRGPVRADDPALTLVDATRRDALERAHAAIALMFWGERLPLRTACTAIRDWIERTQPWAGVL